DVPTKSAPLHHRHREPRQHRSSHQHQPRRRQQPLRPPRIKPRQRHPPLLLQLPDQQPRDQEPRNHKENINPHKPTRKHLHHTHHHEPFHDSHSIGGRSRPWNSSTPTYYLNDQAYCITSAWWSRHRVVGHRWDELVGQVGGERAHVGVGDVRALPVDQDVAY